MPIITLTTDFGTRDGYVGAMKGVITHLVREATLVDITHDIARHDIAHAAWVVATACREFPHHTIHIVVVDPGVGGARQAVIVGARHHYYVGPDNGVFAYLSVGRAWAIANPAIAAPQVSPTFHGRDIFARAAAALALGKDPDQIGPDATLESALPWGPRRDGEGRIVHVDTYGNLISDLPAEEAGAAVAIGGRRLAIGRTYEDVPRGELLAYVGSARTIEVAVREGRADRVLDAPRGTLVVPVVAGEVYR